MKRNPAYRADADLTTKQLQARKTYQRANRDLTKLCELARCLDQNDAAVLKARLCKRVDDAFVALAEAKRLDAQVVDRLTMATMTVTL